MRSYAIHIFFNPQGYIYFIQMDRIGPIKIGYTTNIANRILGLQTSSPYPLRLLCLMVGNEQIEQELHSCYADMRMEGEWFLPHPFIMSEIERLKEHNRKRGFIDPVPEWDLDQSQDDFINYLDGKKFNWKGFFASSDFQIFKRDKSSEVRNAILDKFVTGTYKEDLQHD